MTLALSPTTSALPSLATAGSPSGRVKPINQEELFAVAAAIVEQQEAAAAQQAAAQAQAEAASRAQQLAAENAQLQAQLAARNTGAAQQTSAPAARTATTTPAATATAATTTRAQASTAVDVPSSRVAPRTAHDYWTKHIAQFAGKYLPDGPSMRPNCGPASVTMALRMVGLDIPGFNGQNSEAVLDKARVMGTGQNNISVGTTDTELERIITKSGGRWSESNNFNEMTGWIKQGIPVVLSGNPSQGWNHRYNSSQVYPFDGGHWVTVSGYDKASGNYIVNDPLSQIGPIYVSESELRNYNRSHGNLGIAVFR